ncbi:hypothetical protein CMI37_02360 [Candidatus Pacearchaeota archaeon]|nr:hypothetical protein [Candidatus Pacearchaeota archaeon]
MAHDFSSAGTVVTGADASTRPGAGRLPEGPRADFYLIHNPESWEIYERPDGEYEWLPKLKPLYLTPGVNGVRQVKGGFDDAPARLAVTDRGWTVLDRSLGYITKYPCRRGQSAFLTWNTPVAMGRRVVVRHDVEGYAAWRRELVENGTIAAPEPEALDAVLHRLEQTINRGQKAIHIPGVKARIDANEKKKTGAKKAAKRATSRKRAPRKRAAPSA